MAGRFDSRRALSAATMHSYESALRQQDSFLQSAPVTDEFVAAHIDRLRRHWGRFPKSGGGPRRKIVPSTHREYELAPRRLAERLRDAASTNALLARYVRSLGERGLSANTAVQVVLQSHGTLGTTGYLRPNAC